MGVTQAAGLSLNWFRNNFMRDIKYSDIDEKCENIPVGAEGLIYLPYLMGERTPILDSDTRGVFFGLSAMHSEYHLARAVMEGVSYSLYSCLEILNEIGIIVDSMSLCGGGGKSAFWRQMISDVYGMNITTMRSSEGASLGAAILGGCAANVFSSVDEGCRRMTQKGNVTEFNSSSHGEYLKVYDIYKEIYPALKPLFPQLKKIRR
jgi:xylulokinase